MTSALPPVGAGHQRAHLVVQGRIRRTIWQYAADLLLVLDPVTGHPDGTATAPDGDGHGSSAITKSTLVLAALPPRHGDLSAQHEQWCRTPVPLKWYHSPVPKERKFLVAITATEARKKLFPLIKQVNDDRAPVEIVSNHGRAYLIAADDYESMAETDYLLRSPANATRLMTAAEEVRSGRTLITKTMEELEGMTDENKPQ